MDKHEVLDMAVAPEALRSERSRRRSPFIKETVPKPMVDDYLEQGWEIERENRKSTRMRKLKRVDVAFEDAIWSLFADLGFTVLNKDRGFVLPYGRGESDTRQIDVFAADDETVLIVECKATGGETKRASFKAEIEALSGIKPGLLKTAMSLFPSHKVKVILATSGYIVSGPDSERMEDADIAHFDDDVVEYYQELTKHLGVAARFQLLGRLFAGTKIPGMNNRVPAIQGRMGGSRYYAFSIEPEKLLKIGYVLHRSEANTNLMPTYQRLIKKSRLKSVTAFVESGGFFPNSIIINIDAGRRGLSFDKAALGVEGTESRIGILHLPQTYRSAYIIDGQHRLYGFAATDLAKTETIPVVAFVNLDRADQVRLFMDINENQKAVPKNLQNTLNASIDWDSDNLKRRDKALKLQLAQTLGERKQSPLAGRIVIGENATTKTRCITIESIKVAFDRGNFFGKFTATEMEEQGTFFKGTNDATMSVLLPFLEEVFRELRDELPDQWQVGNSDGGFVFINAGIQSLLRVISDIVDHLVTSDGVNPRTMPTEDLVEFVMYYLDPAISYLRELSPEDGAELKRRYGSGGPVRYWRSLQLAIHEEVSDFDPAGMKEWWESQAQTHNDASREITRKVEELLNVDFRERLEAEYGVNWFKEGLPRKVYKEAIDRAADKSFDRDEDVEPWNALTLINYRDIACKDDAQWQKLFRKRYTMPGAKKTGGRVAHTKWMVRLNQIRNDLAHITHYSVSDDDFEFLQLLSAWLLEGQFDTEDDEVVIRGTRHS